MTTLPIPVRFIAVLLLAVSVDAASLTVNSIADDGTGTCTASKCTLRDAILSAASGDAITFSLPASSAIVLTNGQLQIEKKLAILGPGADQLTVRRSAATGTPEFRIFNITGANGTIAISGLTIANGSVTNANGGGILNTGVLTITNSTISGNQADNGGGIFSTGIVTIANSTFSGNSTRTNDGFGGGIYSGLDILTIIGSNISGNTAGYGGGVYGTMARITNSTISGNTAKDGGGWYLDRGALIISNSTIAGNSASRDGGGLRSVGNVYPRSTIIALNDASNGPDVAGVLTSQGFNLIGNNTNTTIVPTTGDQIGSAAAPIDPGLGPLQDNGGPTRTRALLAGSRAIDKGHSSGSNTDQRGFARLVDSPVIANPGDGSDIGAYEVQPDQLVGCSEINLVVNNNSDASAGSLRSIIASACPGSTITFAANVSGAINLTSGEFLINKNLTIDGPGARTLTISGNNASRIFNVATGARAAVSGLTIANGSGAGNGGGISNSGTLLLSNCAVLNNIAAGSGGGAMNAGTLTIAGCTFAGNQATGYGGALRNVGSITASDSTFSNNTAFSSGAIASFASATRRLRSR